TLHSVIICIFHCILVSSLSLLSCSFFFFFFFFNDTATTEIYTLSLHDALPILHDIVSPAHRTTVQKIRTLMATYEENVELIQIGAYRHGTDPKIDEAIKYYPIIIDYLKQGIYEQETFEQSIEKLHLILAGGQ